MQSTQKEKAIKSYNCFTVITFRHLEVRRLGGAIDLMQPANVQLFHLCSDLVNIIIEQEKIDKDFLVQIEANWDPNRNELPYYLQVLRILDDQVIMD
jgi:hypothetical protein